MRWTIVRLIWARELRDQLRDRRTLFMIAVLLGRPADAGSFIIGEVSERDAAAEPDARRADLVVGVPDDFAEQVRRGGRPTLDLRYRDEDDLSRLVRARFGAVLAKYHERL